VIAVIASAVIGCNEIVHQRKTRDVATAAREHR
jgi:hypothetical protein